MEQLTAQKVVLRSMFDHRKQMWKIVKRTQNGSGGWCRFGWRWHYTMADADQAIEQICQRSPAEYEMDKPTPKNNAHE